LVLFCAFSTLSSHKIIGKNLKKAGTARARDMRWQKWCMAKLIPFTTFAYDMTSVLQITKKLCCIAHLIISHVSVKETCVKTVG
jgi:hypothetical protein